MKKLITFVGTSLFENYLHHENDTDFKNYFESLKDKNFKDYANERSRIGYLKDRLSNWIEKVNNKKDLINISAEIKSISKICQEVDDTIEVYFLTSDTVLSNLVFEIIVEKWKSLPYINSIKINPMETYHASVKDLQIRDRNKFRDGLVNLIRKVDEISQGYWENVIFNITAGYKAVIPYLTILAQVNRCPIYYIFEDTDALIKIPSLPLDINWRVFKENEKFFFDLEVEEIKEIPENLTLKEECENLIERADTLISLNPLGIILWGKYKSSFYLFKISKIAKNYIDSKEGDSKIRDIIDNSFRELFRRLKENPSHPDLDHKISGVSFPECFKTFKHKENNVQVRILYKREDYETRYGTQESRIYIGMIAVGQDVHNVESEYVDTFRRQSNKVENLEEYEVYRIENKEIKL